MCLYTYIHVERRWQQGWIEVSELQQVHTLSVLHLQISILTCEPPVAHCVTFLFKASQYVETPDLQHLPSLPVIQGKKKSEFFFGSWERNGINSMTTLFSLKLFNSCPSELNYSNPIDFSGVVLNYNKPINRSLSKNKRLQPSAWDSLHEITILI